MTHGNSGDQFVLRRPDGTPMSKKEVIIMRRGAFKWLPVLCSNDLVHGSWWMVFGSLGAALFAIVPLIQQYLSFYSQHDDVLPTVDFEVTWMLLIFSGIFYGIGSLAFVRAFEEPPKRALFWFNRHFQTDELLGAWFFLFGTIPSIPYTLVFLCIHPSVIYLGSFASAIVFVLGCIAFVVACYPSGKERGPPRNYILPLYTRWFGFSIWAIKHLANDWLAGTWFFLWANFFLTLGSFIFLFYALYEGIPEQIFIWLSSATNSFLFLIGSLYFVSGSYPHAQQFYYMTNRGTASSETAPTYRQVDTIDPETGLAIQKREILISDNGLEIKQNTHTNTNTNSVISPMHKAVSNTNLSIEEEKGSAAGSSSSSSGLERTYSSNNISPKSSAKKPMKKEDEKILIQQQIKEDIVKSRLDALMMDDDDDDHIDDEDDNNDDNTTTHSAKGYKKI